MTRQEIIAMAKQSGWDEHHAKFDLRIEKFAELIAQHERKNFCAQLAQLHDSYSLASHTTTLRGQL